MANETAHTEVPAGGQVKFPPFDKQTFPSQLFWLTLTFVALYLLMSRIALPRIDSILERRRARIAGDLAEASGSRTNRTRRSRRTRSRWRTRAAAPRPWSTNPASGRPPKRRPPARRSR